MSAKVRRIDFSPDDWIAGTVGLSLAEEGLYMRACALIYSRGGPITVELLKQSCLHDHGNKINACLNHLVALGKLRRVGDCIDQPRCKFELEKAEKRSRNGRENALKRWNNNEVGEQVAMLGGIAKPPPPSSSPPYPPNNYPHPHTPQTLKRLAPTMHRASDDAPDTTSPCLIVENANVRGTRLPVDWRPSAADREFAYACGLDPPEVADQFADHWHAEAGTRALKRDWSATWRNWCRRQHKPGRERHGASGIAAALSRVRFAGED